MQNVLHNYLLYHNYLKNCAVSWTTFQILHNIINIEVQFSPTEPDFVIDMCTQRHETCA